MKTKSKKKKTGKKKSSIAPQKKAALKKKSIKKTVAKPSGIKTKTPKKKKAAKKTKEPVSRKVVKKAKMPARKKAAKKQLFEPLNNLTAFRLEERLSLEVVNPNWQATAQFDNDGGSPITSFTCRMIVPENPDTKSGQTIMIFNGLQLGRRILQPILQWGRSQMTGGGPFWTVGCCLAMDEFTLEEASVLTRVNPGDSVMAVINLLSNDRNRFRYSCFFEGIESSRIDTNAIDELTNCCITLEAARVKTRQHYPTDPSIEVTEVIVRNRNSIITPAWQIGGASNIGEHVELRQMTGSPDEIIIHF
ncbi:hypothetical protein FAM09_10910 [Niastella caeni]|uniref:Uncharacterized protein n=1 Tax=Niastella caeni TaxID=2569763 RepID=A0A4S8HZT3_9BACT|nr:hypothetical protein [Niastella caeni]THU40369.1 hypothetical protein FAM09_10910 [Niastella caeni]